MKSLAQAAPPPGVIGDLGQGWGGVRGEGEETGLRRNEMTHVRVPGFEGHWVREGRGGKEEKEEEP